MMLGRVRPQYVINIVDDRNRARTKLSPRPPGESREINKIKVVSRIREQSHC